MPKFSINHGKQILHDRKAKHLTIEHDVSEYEIEVNTEWCDIGSHKVAGWQIRVIGDTAVCDGCYEHYTDRWN